MDNKEWYVLQTYSGYENKVKTNIESRTESMNMQEHIFRVMVPEQEVVEVVDGVEKVRMEKTFPGYVLVEMNMSDQAWFIVRNTPGVTGFVGSHGAGSKPAPLLPEEVDEILGVNNLSASRVEWNIAEGDYVQIIEGAFSGFTGQVEEIDKENEKVKVVIEMFGRETVAELDFIQVKKEEV